MRQAMRIYDMCKEEMDSNQEAREDLIDMDLEYQLNLCVVDESYSRAKINNTKSQLVLRQTKKNMQWLGKQRNSNVSDGTYQT